MAAGKVSLYLCIPGAGAVALASVGQDLHGASPIPFLAAGRGNRGRKSHRVRGEPLREHFLQQGGRPLALLAARAQGDRRVVDLDGRVR